LATLFGISQQGFTQELNHLFKAGEDGYACFRIPAIVATTKRTVLAFCEARRNNCGDAGDIDLVVKRSADNGKTWSKLLWCGMTMQTPVVTLHPLLIRKPGGFSFLQRGTWAQIMRKTSLQKQVGFKTGVCS
jgi:hypothetical protein